MSHIMQSLPITRDGKKLTSVPGMTLLMYAAATGDPEMVNQVFRYDSDLEAQDSEVSNCEGLGQVFWIRLACAIAGHRGGPPDSEESPQDLPERA